MITAIFSFHHIASPLRHARSALMVTYHEMLRDYRQAAAQMAGWDCGHNTDAMNVWRRDLYRSAGMSMLLSGHFSEAIDWFGRVVQNMDAAGKKQDDYFALIYRGIGYWKIGQPEQAREDWDVAFRSIPERHDAFVVMGHSRLLEGDLLSAHAHYRRALELGGQLGPVYADIGDAWRYIGNTIDAAYYYREGLGKDSTDVFCRLRQGELALIADDDPEIAFRECALIRRLMPNLRVVEQLESAAHNWVSGGQLEHIPAARFASGPAHTWKVSPSRLYFEFFREEWHGW